MRIIASRYCPRPFYMRMTSKSLCIISFCMRIVTRSYCIQSFCMRAFSRSFCSFSFSVGNSCGGNCTISFCMRIISRSFCTHAFCHRIISACIRTGAFQLRGSRTAARFPRGRRIPDVLDIGFGLRIVIARIKNMRQRYGNIFLTGVRIEAYHQIAVIHGNVAYHAVLYEIGGVNGGA